MASPAFLIRLVSACEIIVPSSRRKNFSPSGRSADNLDVRLPGLLQTAPHRGPAIRQRSWSDLFRFRHPGKFREFVDNATQIPGLAYDDTGHLFQRVGIFALPDYVAKTYA